MTTQRPKLRIREIVFAVAMGGVAAGGAALVLSEMGDNPPPIESREQPSGQEYQLADFEDVSTTGPQEVVITQDDEFSVRAEGSPRMLNQIEAVVERGTLKIQPKRGSFRGDWEGLEGTIFYVTMPKLEAVNLAGSGQVQIDQLKGERFSGTIAGEGELTIGSMEVEDVEFSIGGTGSVVASGTASRTRVSIGGNGDVDAEALHSKTASIAIGGNGDVALSVDDEATIEIFGRGDVDISGSAHCTVTKVGFGDVRCESEDVSTDGVTVNINQNGIEVRDD